MTDIQKEIFKEAEELQNNECWTIEWGARFILNCKILEQLIKLNNDIVKEIPTDELLDLLKYKFKQPKI